MDWKIMFIVWLIIIILQEIIGIVSFIMWIYYDKKIEKLNPNKIEDKIMDLKIKIYRIIMLIMAPFGGGIILISVMLIFREDYKNLRNNKVSGILDRL